MSLKVSVSSSVVSDSATPWIVAPQASLSMGFPRHEYWSGLLCPSPGDLPDPGVEPGSRALQADSLPLRHQGSPYVIRGLEIPARYNHILIRMAANSKQYHQIHLGSVWNNRNSLLVELPNGTLEDSSAIVAKLSTQSLLFTQMN
ncbi:unnamed protein product [Rangifer tarandus platyrhynchus]|uniref:Uncharacterized protein n=2 Tax=Rangifer tarandus platyrhynchus TaxID=3082113 RepID=A0ABN8XY85_RANTA|nr:unnamed protein product [Rangifer tarandus platyrhynchus]